MYVTESLIKAEVLARLLLNALLDTFDALGKPAKYTSNISSLLHGDNSELILFIDPDEEGFLVIMEDTTTLRPVSLHTSNSQVPISRDEQEVIVNQLLANLLIHALAGTYSPLQGMNEQVRQQLVDDHFLFVSGDRNLTVAGMERDWPEGRGIFHNDKKTFLIWVNE